MGNSLILVIVGFFGVFVGAFLPYMIRDLVESYKHKKWLEAENKRVEAAKAARDAFRAKLAEDARNGHGVYIQQVGRALRTNKKEGVHVDYVDGKGGQING